MASLSDHLVLRVFSPSPLLSGDDKLKDLTNQINVQLDLVTTIFRRLLGEAGDGPVEFQADLDIHGNRILNMADPENELDAANRRWVTSQIDDVREELTEIQDEVHTGLGGGGQSFSLQRDMPVVVDDTVEIGTWNLTNDAHAFDIAIVVSESGFSVAKAYSIVTNRAINSAWQIALPLVDTGAGSSQNFDLDVKQDDGTSTLSLRIRRTAGTTAGQATIQILSRGNSSDLFTEASGTASVTAPTAFLESAILTVRDGNVIIGDTGAVSGQKVLAVAAGTAPGGVLSSAFLAYAASAGGGIVPHFLCSNGDLIILYTEAVLTAVNNGAFSTGGTEAMTTADATILDNMRARIADLEARLTAFGLIG